MAEEPAGPEGRKLTPTLVPEADTGKSGTGKVPDLARGEDPKGRPSPDRARAETAVARAGMRR